MLRLGDGGRGDQADQVAAQGARVGQAVQVDLDAAQMADGVEEQLPLGRPAEVDGGLAGPGPGGTRSSRSSWASASPYSVSN